MAKVNMASLNEDPPPVKNGLMRWGVGVDGVSFYVHVELEPKTAICRQCEGEGTLHFNVGYDGFERWEKCRCENCDGEGVVDLNGEDEQ